MRPRRFQLALRLRGRTPAVRSDHELVNPGKRPEVMFVLRQSASLNGPPGIVSPKFTGGWSAPGRATGRRRIVTRFRWIPRAGSEHLEIVDAVGAGDLFGDADEDVLRHPVLRPFRHVELA